MFQRAKLQDFLVDAFPDVQALRRFVCGLECGKAIEVEISWSLPLAQVVFDLLRELASRNELDRGFYAALRVARPKRTAEIDEIDPAGTAKPLHRAWRLAQIQRFAGRQVLHRVSDVGVELDRVYIGVDLRLQIPNVSTPRSECDVDDDPRRSEHVLDEVHGAGVYEKTFDLDEWLVDAREDTTPLIVEGEVGTGKTERIIHAVTALARRGEHEPTTLLPLWFDAKMLTKGLLQQIMANHVGWTEARCSELLADSTAHFAVFVDSLDEVGQSVHTAIEELRARLGTRMRRLVLAMRPTRRRSFRDVQVVRIMPWLPDKSTSFLHKYRVFDAKAIDSIEMARRTGLPDDVFTNPLTATLSVLVARDQPNALGHRTKLFRAIVDRMVEGWQRQRAESSGNRGRWGDLTPWLAKLALERLRSHPDGFDEAFLRDRLDAWTNEGSEAWLEVLTAQYGVFVRVGEKYDFALRWLADYLAGLALAEDVSAVVAASRRTWGFEAARHAIATVYFRSPELGTQCIAALLQGEDRDQREDRPLYLRRVLLTVTVAADLSDAFPAAVVEPLVNSVCRRLFAETSVWIGSEVATAVRALARAQGPVWTELLARILPLLTDPMAPCGDPSMDDPRRMLRHRSAEARIFAAEQLAELVDEPEIQEDLCALLVDHAWAPSPAFAAGKALRTARRDTAFMTRLDDLRELLEVAPQIQAGAAAFALQPHEASIERLLVRLAGAANVGEDVRPAVVALASTPEGRDLLDRRSPGWRERKPKEPSPRMAGPRPRLSEYVRWDLIRCIAPALHTLPAGSIAEIAAIGQQSHALSHELLYISHAVAPEVVHALLRRYFCGRRMDDLMSLVADCPAVGDVLLARWAEIVAHGCKEHECVAFPGQALAPMAEQGREDAVTAIAAWLPHSELGQPQWVWDGPVLSPATFSHPSVLAAASGRILAAEKFDDETRSKAYQRLSAGWDESKWTSLAAQLAPSVADSFGCWKHVTELCAYADLPERFAHQAVVYARALLGVHRDSEVWHTAALAALQFLDTHRLTSQATAELRRLVGFDGGLICAYLRPVVASLVMPALSETEQRMLSARLAKTLADDLDVLSTMSAAALEAIVRPSPEAWLDELVTPETSLFKLSALADPSTVHWRLWRALPPQVTGPQALVVLRSGKCPTVPWILLQEPGYRRPMRMIDLMWQFAYEGGVEADYEL